MTRKELMKAQKLVSEYNMVTTILDIATTHTGGWGKEYLPVANFTAYKVLQYSGITEEECPGLIWVEEWLKTPYARREIMAAVMLKKDIEELHDMPMHYYHATLAAAQVAYKNMMGKEGGGDFIMPFDEESSNNGEELPGNIQRVGGLDSEGKSTGQTYVFDANNLPSI